MTEPVVSTKEILYVADCVVRKFRASAVAARVEQSDVRSTAVVAMLEMKQKLDPKKNPRGYLYLRACTAVNRFLRKQAVVVSLPVHCKKILDSGLTVSSTEKICLPDPDRAEPDRAVDARRLRDEVAKATPDLVDAILHGWPPSRVADELRVSEPTARMMLADARSLLATPRIVALARALR